MRTCHLYQILNERTLSLVKFNDSHYLFTFHNKEETFQVDLKFKKDIAYYGFFKEKVLNKSYFTIEVIKGDTFIYRSGDEEYDKLVKFMNYLEDWQSRDKKSRTDRLIRYLD